MQRETLTAHAGTTPVTRATIEPYVDGVPGPRFYQRYAHGVGLDAERLLGELDGGRALLFPSGMAAICSLALATLGPGRRSRSPTAATTARSGCCAAS